MDIWHSLVEDADVVAFLYYDRVYNDFSERQNIAELLIEKNRNGPIATIEFKYDETFNLFSEISNTEDKV